MDLYKNPEFEPQDDEHEDVRKDVHDFPTTIAGAGGRTTNRENNERGILDHNVFRAMEGMKSAALGCDHAHRVGIYTTNHTESY